MISTQWAIIIAGAIVGGTISATIAFIDRWAIATPPAGTIVYRLDHWTGTVMACLPVGALGQFNPRC
jgi:hypothetical protein